MGRARKARQKPRDVPPAATAPPWPRASRAVAGWTAAVVFALALAAYGRTLAPTVTLVDSGELIVAAHGLGVAHPPGFPLYVLLGHAASRVPAGNVAQRLNAFSALGAALAAAALALATRRALAWDDGAAGPPADPGVPAWITATPLAIAGLLLAGARSLWAYATVAEVYALSTLAVVALVALALRTRDAVTSAAFAGLAAAYGLATGTHHVTIALVGPGLLALVWTPLRRVVTPRRLALYAAVGFGAAAIAYAYLPWAAAGARFPNWGDPRTLERVWWHVSGRQYLAYLTPSAESMGAEAGAFARALLGQFGPEWFPAALGLAGVGLVGAWRRARALAIALGLVIACDLAYALLYTIAEDKDAYYLPAVVAVCLAAGLGARDLLARAARFRPVIAAALLAVPIAGAALQARALDRSRFLVAHDFARDALASIAPGGLLLTSEWQLYSPLLYFQEIEGWRPDVMAVDVSLLRRSWYVDAMRARYPARWQPLRAETDAFLEDLRAWEHDPGLYERDVALNRRINDRFQAVVLALARTGSAYATSEVLLPPSPDPTLADRLRGALPITPVGLVFSFKAPFDDAPAPPLAPRGLFDGTIAIDDVVRTKVAPVYVSMMTNRGHFLRSRGDAAGAQAAYDQARVWGQVLQ